MLNCNCLVTGDPDQHMESLGVVAIINSSLVTEGGGVPLIQLLKSLLALKRVARWTLAILGQAKRSWKRG